VGALYVRDQLSPLLLGGQQERGRRAGTENVPAIAGFGAACRLAAQDLGGRADRIRALRERLLARLLAIPGAELHGDPGHRAPGTANVGFAGVEGELLMMNLDLCGVAVSTGAACSSGSVEPSPVLRALGYTREEAARAVRFSLGSGNTAEEVDQVAGLVEESVTRIRSLG
jgi:cysteine desulfurase